MSAAYADALQASTITQPRITAPMGWLRFGVGRSRSARNTVSIASSSSSASTNAAGVSGTSRALFHIPSGYRSSGPAGEREFPVQQRLPLLAHHCRLQHPEPNPHAPCSKRITLAVLTVI